MMNLMKMDYLNTHNTPNLQITRGDKVPDILLSGHHAKIQEWRTQQSLLLTKKVRPDLFEKHQFTEYEEKSGKNDASKRVNNTLFFVYIHIPKLEF